jgi:hypothetical protein
MSKSLGILGNGQWHDHGAGILISVTVMMCDRLGRLQNREMGQIFEQKLEYSQTAQLLCGTHYRLPQRFRESLQKSRG